VISSKGSGVRFWITGVPTPWDPYKLVFHDCSVQVRGIRCHANDKHNCEGKEPFLAAVKLGCILNICPKSTAEVDFTVFVICVRLDVMNEIADVFLIILLDFRLGMYQREIEKTMSSSEKPIIFTTVFMMLTLISPLFPIYLLHFAAVPYKA
jgi:hypothetical protein